MGQKVHPIGFRLGFNKTWRSRWYAGKEYSNLLHEDLALKKDLKKRFSHAGVSRVDIERAANKLKISIFTSRPGIIIGRKGQEVDKLKQEVQKKTGKEVFINIQEILKPELDAQLVAESVALQLEKRIAFRRAMRKAVDAALRFGAKGIKVRVSGRLNGAEIARSEWYLHGQLPLHTLRADIDYGLREAHTTYGRIGVKVWLYKGDILPYKASTDKASREAAMAVGEASGTADTPRTVVSSRRARAAAPPPPPEQPAPEPAETAPDDNTPLVKEGDPEFERLLAEEEAIEATLKDKTGEPLHFRPEDGD
jgi:small subunit ribosomal protein S3